MLQKMKARATLGRLPGTPPISCAHIPSDTVLQHCLLATAAFLSELRQMTHGDYRMIMFSFNKSDARSADQVLSSRQPSGPEQCRHFITEVQ